MHGCERLIVDQRVGPARIHFQGSLALGVEGLHGGPRKLLPGGHLPGRPEARAQDHPGTVEIGRKLFLTPPTVRSHVAALLRKFGVRDREALRARFAEADPLRQADRL